MDETFIFYLDRPLSTKALTIITEVSSYTYLLFGQDLQFIKFGWDIVHTILQNS